MAKERMTVGQFLKSYWKDCINNIKHPLNLLPTVLLSVVWIVLGWMAAKAKLALPLKVIYMIWNIISFRGIWKIRVSRSFRACTTEGASA